MPHQNNITNTLFKTFTKRYHPKQQEILNFNQDTIIHEVLANRFLAGKKDYTSSEISKITAEFENIIHVNGYDFPCFVANGEDIEPDQDTDNTYQSYQRAARNFLRHLTRGAMVKGGIAGHAYKKSLALIEGLVDKQMNSRLLEATRIEMQALLANAASYLTTTVVDADKEKQFEIFLSHLLAVYPFLNPEDKEFVTVPQKINGVWINVKYQFNKLDISPNTGLLSYLIEDRDRIYAYGLTPCNGENPAAKSHLLMMGTTYPTGQGAKLSDLYNFRPTYSVGEGHNLSEVSGWIQQQKNKVMVTGHSQGAVIAMIIAAKYPNKIAQADCLNPTGLRQATLDRLQQSWSKAKEKEKPAINVYAQKGDPVFPLELAFLEGTNIYKVLPANNKHSNYKWFLPQLIQKTFEAHLHHFAGRESVLFLKINPARENATYKRKFFTHVKWFVNIIKFYFLYTHLAVTLCARKINRFHEKNKTLINVLGIFLLIALGVALASTVLFSPLSGLILLKLGLDISPIALPYVVAGMGVAIGAFSSLIIKPVVRYAALLIEFVTFTALPSLLTAANILIGSVLAAIKLGFERAFCNGSRDKYEEKSEDTITRLSRTFSDSQHSSATPLRQDAKSYQRRASAPSPLTTPGNQNFDVGIPEPISRTPGLV